MNPASSQFASMLGAAPKVIAPSMSRFVESVRVRFQGGRGGDGCISMLSLFANEFAGPDGGNGGCGGHIVLKANKQVKSLSSVKRNYFGAPGENGRGKNLYGLNASHTLIEVPVGTFVTQARPKHLAEYEFDPDKSDVIAHLDRQDSMFIAARGGAGGRGNNSYLSNENRHPRIAQAGALGEINTYELALRVYAHIGLIGLPNVGKSTLLKTLTNAQVKIGNYEFTTLHPQVGIIDFDDYTQVAIADLPGLIQDSNKNRGLGVQFLRNVRHCVCLLYVIDLASESYSPIEQLETLWGELETYKKDLSRRPHIVFANKTDHPRAEGKLSDLRDFLAAERPQTKLMSGSTLRGDNLAGLRVEFRRMYDEYQALHADDPDDALIW